MAMQRRMPVDRYTVCQDYIITRGKAITFPASNFKMKIEDDTVYGVVVDMPMGPRVLTTMVCFLNGAANLYFNLGGDYSGAAQKYPNVVQATRVLVANAGQFLETAKKTTQFDLPKGNEHFIYLMTKNGVYKTSLNPATVKDDPKKRMLFAMYQRVMAELRVAQLKDKAANA